MQTLFHQYLGSISGCRTVGTNATSLCGRSWTQGCGRYPAEKKEASTGALDNKGRSPMLLAAIRGHTEIFACLSQSPTELSPSPTFTWQQLLHTASRYGHIGIIEQLIAGRNNLEQPNAQGQAPLLIASSNGRCSTVRFLIKKGCDINHRDLKQRTAFSLAAESGHDDVVRFLLGNKADGLALDMESRSALHIAAFGGHSRVEYLLAGQMKLLDLEDNEGLTPLYLAVQSRSSETVAILLSRGANPNLNTMLRPLDLLEQPPSKNDPLTDLLLQHGAIGNLSRVDNIRSYPNDVVVLENESEVSTDYYAHSMSVKPNNEDVDKADEDRESNIKTYSGRWVDEEESNDSWHIRRRDDEEENNNRTYPRRRYRERDTNRWYVESSDHISDADESDTIRTPESYKMKRGASNGNGDGVDKRDNDKTNDGKGGDDKMDDRQGLKDLLVFMWWTVVTMIMLTVILALMMMVIVMMVIIVMWTMFVKIHV